MKKFILFIVFWNFIVTGFAQNPEPGQEIHEVKINYDYSQENLGTIFTTSENSYVLKLNLFRHPYENAQLLIRIWTGSDNNYTLIAGPFSWNISSGPQGWMEFEFPYPIAVQAGKTYLISFENSSDDKENRAPANAGGPDHNNLRVNISSANENSKSVKPASWFINSSGRIKIHAILNVRFDGGTIGKEQAICYNSVPARLTQVIPPTGGDGTYAYQWQSSTNNINWTNIAGATSESYLPPALTSSRWYRRIVTSGVFGTARSNEILITVYPVFSPGTIGSSQTICYNSAPSTLNQILSPTGGDGVYSFQWQYSTDNISWINIPDATDSSYSPEALTSGRWFRRNVISKDCGQLSSNPVRITVINELVPGTIGSAQSVCYHTAPATLTQLSPASGGTGSFTYQWQISENGSNWTNIPGATQTTYSSPVMNNSSYFRRIVNSSICSSPSNIILVTVYPEMLPGSIGSPQTICHNTVPARLTQVSAPEGGTGSFAFQWQSSLNNSIWTDIPDATLADYSPPALTVSTYFRRNVTSAECGTTSSAPVLITVNAALDPGSIGSSQSICFNEIPATLAQVSPPAGGTGNYTFQWQNSPNNSDWSDIAEATLGSYSPPALTANTYYRRNITSGECGTVSSNSILITVNPSLAPGSVGYNQTICYNTVPDQIVQVNPPTGGTGSYNYQWQSSANNTSWSDIAGATSSSFSPPSLTTTIYYRRAVRSANCSLEYSNPVQITVYPAVSPGSVGTSQTICHNTVPAQLIQISAPSGGNGTFTFQWQSSANNSSWTNIPGATQASYSPQALTATTYFRRNAISGECGTFSSASIIITVNAVLEPGSVGSSQSICYNDVPSTLVQTAAPSGGTGTYSYQWQRSSDESVWSDIPGATQSSYSPPALTANTYYRRNITSGNCGSVSSNHILITVNPAMSPGSIGNNQTICYNNVPAPVMQINPPSGGTGSYNYQWQSSGNNTSWSDIPGATSTSYSPPALTSTTYFRLRVRSGGCMNYTNSVSINVHDRINQAQLHDSRRIQNNTATNFHVTISGGQGPFTINYERNGSAQPVINNYINESNISTGILTTGTYTYTLTSVTDANGCHAQNLGSSITITVLPDQATATNNALVIVNSSSAYYSDYTRYIKPYLDYFGIPYEQCNVASSALPSFSDYAVLIFGHRNVYSSNYPISQLETAISDGTGLYSFDPHLFDYSSSFNTLISSRSVTSRQIAIPNYSHYITSYHAPDVYNPNSNIIDLQRNMNAVQGSSLNNGITLATMGSGSQNVSLLQASTFGNGKIVKWCSYDWVFDNILGPVFGMDDLIWKGIVWAARKPFVMQGIPPFVTMRVDDTDGSGPGVIENFEWIRICNDYGIIPWIGTFNNDIRRTNIPTLKGLLDNNLATAFPHAFTGDDFIYFNHQNLPSFDPAANVRAARDFYITHGLKFSKYLVPHFYEISSEALREVRNIGAEFIATHMLPDQFYFASPPTPWINCGPYRINRNGNASGDVPVYYAGYVNLNGIQFFNCMIEITDDGGYEWYPDNDVVSTVARGIRHLRRSFHSMALASLFTHEYFFANISPANWREIIRQITSNITEYSPEYRSTDYAVQYLRAKQNIVITNVVDNLNSVTISYTGSNDMDTRCYLFNESGGNITFRYVTLPQTNGNNTVTISQ
ncbi:MAG TPA: DUF4082 domain-containing protein [Bacteroidales bacterium]|nr:DUF4082 domain-containing protein [Bacteroidales bacterium]